MDGRTFIKTEATAQMCENAKIRLIQKVCVLCASLVFAAMEKYNVLCDMGMAITVTLIEMLVIEYSAHISRMAISSQNCEQFAIR